MAVQVWASNTDPQPQAAQYMASVLDSLGYKATVKYQSGATVKYQDVLIKDNAFRIGDSKFTVARAGVAQVKTVITNPANGAVVGSAPRALDLYVLLDGHTIHYATVGPGGFEVIAEGTGEQVRVELIDGGSVWYAVEVPA